MTILSPNVLPPPGPKPDFHKMAMKAATQRVDNQWFRIPAQRFTIGFDDPETDEGPDRFFAWDNEREPYQVSVHAFEAQARPASNHDYVRYLLDTGGKTLPVTWSETNGRANGAGKVPQLNREATELSAEDRAFERYIDRKAIRTVYGHIPLRYALDWPLMASYNEVAAYAPWAKARIPTLHEVRSIHEHVERGKAKRDGV